MGYATPRKEGELPASPMLSEWQGDIDYRGQGQAAATPRQEVWAEVDYGDGAVAASPRRTPRTLKESLGIEDMAMRPDAAMRPESHFAPHVEHSGNMTARSESVLSGADQLSARSNKVMWPDGSCYEGDRVNGYAHGR